MGDENQQTARNLEPIASSPGAASLPWTAHDTLGAGLQAFVIFLVYVRTLRFDFVLDDIPLILKNPDVVAPWRAVPHFFIEGFFDRLSPGTPANVYRPLFSVWLLVNQRFWGFNPAAWHFAAILLLILVSLGVSGMARRLFQSRRLAVFAGLLFALHPIHVESTAWVIGANESLMAVLFVSGFAAYLRFLRGGRHRRVWLALSLMAFAMALLTKEEAIVLPALVAGFVWVYGRRGEGFTGFQFRSRGREALLGSALYWALAAGYLVVRFQVLHGLSHTATVVPLGYMFRIAPLVLWRDLQLLLWPSGLTIFYESPYVTSITLSNFLLPLALVLALTTAVVVWGRRSRAVAFAAIWLIVPVLPFLDLRILPDGEFIHDRYLYLSSIGFALLLAAGARAMEKFRWPSIKPGRIELALAILLGSSYGGVSFHDSQFWASEAAIDQRAMTVAPESNFALVQGAYQRALSGQCEAAGERYQKVLARSPRYWRAYSNLGVCHYKSGAYQTALNDLAQAAEIAPGEPDVYFYIGLSQYQLGNLAVAENALHRAVELRPDGPGYHLALGSVLKAEGDADAALSEFHLELAYHPGEARAQAEITQEKSPPRRNWK